jgi:allophanate hydrolase
MGSRSTHLVAGIGAAVAPGPLPLGDDPGGAVELRLAVSDRFGGGVLRSIASAQTGNFSAYDLERLQTTSFSRDPRGNRMGARLSFEGAPFQPEGGLSILSEMVVPGDIQIAGDGAPFVLLGECQTTGGYPRIGTIIPPDLPRVAQARPGEPLRIEMITRSQALQIYAAHEAALRALNPEPARRDPHDIGDLLSYQLVSGVIRGDEP